MDHVVEKYQITDKYAVTLLSNNFDKYDQDYDGELSLDEYKKYSKATILELQFQCWVIYLIFLNGFFFYKKLKNYEY